MKAVPVVLVWVYFMTTTHGIKLSQPEVEASGEMKERMDKVKVNDFDRMKGAEKKTSNMRTSDERVPQEEFDDAIGSITGKIDTLVIINQQITERLDNIESNMQENSNDLIAAEKDIDGINERHKVIGFTAYNNHDYKVSQWQVLKYTSVTTNSGNGYDPDTGVFTCPVKGLYYFAVTTFTSPTRSMVQLVNNGWGLMTAFADHTDEDQGNNSWLLSCNPGQRIWTRLTSDNASIPKQFKHYSGMLHSFVGFLVAPA